ncbi:MAG TPA: hypothetical protein VEY30_02625 [Myxococcaceae bacterium]|nr:hypothetical protein [Myxococcaceae bacterium]
MTRATNPLRQWTAYTLCALTLASCTGRDHPLEEGEYRFTTEAILADGCGLSGAEPFTWTGRLQANGNFVRLTYDPLAIRLEGSYRESSDTFAADGTRGPVSVTLGGQNCDVEFAGLSLQGITDSETEFHGTVLVRYDTDGSDRCFCETRSTYRASRL